MKKGKLIARSGLIKEIKRLTEIGEARGNIIKTLHKEKQDERARIDEAMAEIRDGQSREASYLLLIAGLTRSLNAACNLIDEFGRKEL